MYKPKIGDRVIWTGNKNTTGKPSDTTSVGIIMSQYDSIADVWEVKWKSGTCLHTWQENLDLAGPKVFTESF